MNFLVRLLLSTLAVMLTSYLLPGVEVKDFTAAFMLAALLALFNVTLKPILILLTIPITFVTLGLFLLAINAFLILLADSIIDGFMVRDFWWALAFSLILSIVTNIFESVSRKREE